MARVKQTCCRRPLPVSRGPAVKPIWPHERELQKRTLRTKVRTISNTQQSAASVFLQRSCSFLKLPRELRNEIYSLLLPSYTTLNFAAPTWYDNAAGRFFDIRFDMSQYYLTVLALCRQIRAEANALLYGTNHFKFSIGRGGGPSPFNTIRALPQSGISQIKACTIHVFIFPGLEKRELSPIRDWVHEMCKLLKQGGNLQEIEIEIGLHHLDTADPLDFLKFERLLKPLECLSGLKSVNIKGLVTDAYRAELKRVVEDDGTRKYKKRKAGTDSEEDVVVLRPKKKRTNK